MLEAKCHFIPSVVDLPVPIAALFDSERDAIIANVNRKSEFLVYHGIDGEDTVENITVFRHDCCMASKVTMIPQILSYHICSISDLPDLVQMVQQCSLKGILDRHVACEPQDQFLLAQLGASLRSRCQSRLFMCQTKQRRTSYRTLTNCQRFL